MLTRFELRNFKRFDESGIALDPRLITVLIGANGSGKSSVLQALMLLKQSRAQGGLIVSGGSSNLGTYRDVVHLQQVDRHIEFGLVVTVDSSPDALVMREGKLADEVEFDSGGVYRSRGS